MIIQKVRVNGITKMYGLIAELGDHLVLKELKKDGTFHGNRKQIIVETDNTDYWQFDKKYGVGQVVTLKKFGMDDDTLEVGNHRVRGSFNIKGEMFHFEVLEGWAHHKVQGEIMSVKNCLHFSHLWSDNHDENTELAREIRKSLIDTAHFLKYTKVNIMHTINTVFNDNVIGNLILEDR